MAGCTPVGSKIEALLEHRIGDRVYEVIQQDNTVGYLHTHTGRDAQGNWVMTQHLNINMLNAPPYVSEQRQVFAKTAPHKLLAANLDEIREHQHQIIGITAAETGYTVVIERDADTEVVERQWEYSLTDQLHLDNNWGQPNCWQRGYRAVPGYSQAKYRSAPPPDHRKFSFRSYPAIRRGRLYD